MRRLGILMSLVLAASLGACGNFRDLFSAHADVAAEASGQELPSKRLAQILHVDADDAGFAGTPDNAVLERACEELREDGDQVKAHWLYLSRQISVGTVQVTQAVGQQYFDAASGQIDSLADVLGERDQQFTLRRIHGQQWSAGLILAREIDVADLA